MNVASKELCQQLYELSEWNATSSVLQYWVYQATLPSRQRRHKRDEWRLENIMRINEDYGVGAITDTDSFIPAYDLGYLLRKLPPVVTLKSRAGNRWSAQCYRGRMTEDGSGVEKVDVDFTTDTPENAACKLLIELIKQKVIKVWVIYEKESTGAVLIKV